MNVKQNIESEPRLRAYYHASRHKQSDPASIKSQVIRLRVTEAEAQLFKTNAAAAGCKSDRACNCSGRFIIHIHPNDIFGDIRLHLNDIVIFKATRCNLCVRNHTILAIHYRFFAPRIKPSVVDYKHTAGYGCLRMGIVIFDENAYSVFCAE